MNSEQIKVTYAILEDCARKEWVVAQEGKKKELESLNEKHLQTARKAIASGIARLGEVGSYNVSLSESLSRQEAEMLAQEVKANTKINCAVKNVNGGRFMYLSILE